jgi:hypothetical protein
MEAGANSNQLLHPHQDLRQSAGYQQHSNQSLFLTDSRIEENKWGAPNSDAPLGNGLSRRDTTEIVSSNGGFLYSGDGKKKMATFRVSLVLKDQQLQIQLNQAAANYLPPQ